MSRSADRQGATSYPQQWEADVVLRDGGTARIRPICPQDAEALRVFHARLSPETVYFRYFAPHPELSAEEISHLTNVDHHDRVALVVLWRGEIIGVGRYDRIDEESAEVAFVILDDAQGRGVGSLLLEHLAAAGREQGIEKFIAEVLPQNGRMLATFRFAGYAVSQATDDGVVHVSFDIAESVNVDAVRESRAHRSEARSLEPLLRPRSIAVVGASRRSGSVGNTLLLNLITGGFTGQLFIVHPDADQISGIPCVRSLTEVGSEIDLVAVCVPADDVMTVVADAAKAHAKGLIIISGGFETSEAAAHLGRFARSEGIRLLGPAAFGLINTEVAISVNCSLAQPMPAPGRTAFFCQSGALGADILRRMRNRGLGVSSFISAGHRADVSGNDALQYWAEDSHTTSILMHLETLGNPRKFASLLSRVAQSKPIVVLRTTGAQAHDPVGEYPTGDTDKARALDQILADSGVIEVPTIDHMLDVAEILTHSGVLAGPRIGIVGNSEALEILAVNATEQEGLLCVSKPRTMARASTADMYRRRLDEALRDDAVDIVLALHVPPVESTNDLAVAEVISEFASGLAKPVVAVVLGVDESMKRYVGKGSFGSRHLAIFSDVERALQAIGSVVRYSQTRKHLQQSSTTEVIGDVDPVRARSEVERLLTEGSNRISSIMAAEILGAYNIEISPTIECEPPDALITGIDDPRLGRLLSIDLADPVATLFTRTRYALSPISLDDALRLVRTSAVSVWLSSRVGSDAPGFTMVAVEQAVVDMARLVHRVGELMHDVPQIVDVRLEISLSRSEVVKVTAATIQMSKSGTDRPWATRSLTPVTG